MVRYDIVGIGSALIDFTASVSEEFLKRHGLVKGTMSLCDEEPFGELLASLPVVEGQAGGSTANALAAASLLGAKTLLVARIGKGSRGALFEKLTEAAGVALHAASGVKAQGGCLVLVTPDAQRTFVTFLGAATELAVGDIDLEALKGCKFLLIEGYQLDNNKDALLLAAQEARKSGVKVALDVSDAFLVDRQRESLKDLAREADVLFLNEDECLAYTGKRPAEALEALPGYETVVVKLGAQGSIVRHRGEVFCIPGSKVEAVNTNGAGDAYAGAFLACLVNGKGVQEAARIASFLAAQVVASYYSRLQQWMLP